jgi:D-tyrosyl-tRNA(Tyr) deacylase
MHLDELDKEIDAINKNQKLNIQDQDECDEWSIDEQLDKCVELMIDCYTKLLEKHDSLNDCLNQAFLKMSKARSLMGCHNVSMLQIPTETLKPLVAVDLHQSTRTCEINKLVSLNHDHTQFELKKFTNENDELVTSDFDLNIPMPKWFGVLTPTSLRESQKSFVKSFLSISALCELQTQYKHLEILYKNLLAKKSQQN